MLGSKLSQLSTVFDLHLSQTGCYPTGNLLLLRCMLRVLHSCHCFAQVHLGLVSQRLQASRKQEAVFNTVALLLQASLSPAPGHTMTC